MAHPVYLGRDLQTKKRNYHNRTIQSPTREAQATLVGNNCSVSAVRYSSFRFPDDMPGALASGVQRDCTGI
jgi:hypothetical protein